MTELNVVCTLRKSPPPWATTMYRLSNEMRGLWAA
jgi:hypothetical protein